MAKQADHVTMLQRSPTYMVARPDQDALANWLRRYLPAGLAYRLTRWKNVLLGMYFFSLCRRKPERVKAMLLGELREQLGPDYDIDTHFTPSYNPWDQRMCLVPNGDLFEAIREQRAEIVTDRIATFTAQGVRLESGEEIEADLVVTATGLQLQFLAGLRLPPAQLHGRARFRAVSAAAARSRGAAGAVPGSAVGLHPACHRTVPETGLEDALEAVSELRPGSGESGSWPGGRRHPGVLRTLDGGLRDRDRGGVGGGLRDRGADPLGHRLRITSLLYNSRYDPQPADI